MTLALQEAMRTVRPPGLAQPLPVSLQGMNTARLTVWRVPFQVPPLCGNARAHTCVSLRGRGHASQSAFLARQHLEASRCGRSLGICAFLPFCHHALGWDGSWPGTLPPTISGSHTLPGSRR